MDHHVNGSHGNTESLGSFEVDQGVIPIPHNDGLGRAPSLTGDHAISLTKSDIGTNRI